MMSSPFIDVVVIVCSRVGKEELIERFRHMARRLIHDTLVESRELLGA